MKVYFIPRSFVYAALLLYNRIKTYTQLIQQQFEVLEYIWKIINFKHKEPWKFLKAFTATFVNAFVRWRRRHWDVTRKLT